jgi:hypothetical protein
VKPAFARLCLASFLALAGSACAAPNPDATTTLVGPDRPSFDSVQPFLDHRCGTLDCHGTRYRNLRLWGHDGMRLAFGDVPGASPTTSAEVDASYEAIVALEPEIMSAVVADRGAHPERLTLVRKARGTEQHAGGAIVAMGDVRDVCITSWLAGQTDETACAAALVYP